MVKRIFIIIGIVLGSVTGFVGITVGVMAAMGKFNTPQIHPTTLEFETSNVRVVADDQIHSFSLLGTNSSYSEDVNQTECLIWFENNVGADLIELVDSEGNPLKAQNFRYTINCNENSYYKIKPLTESNKNKNSVAVLLARSANGKTSTNVPLTIEIDRNVESVFVNKDINSTANTTSDGKAVQNIYISTSSELIFDYVVNPDKSLKPIDSESSKEIELYYDSPEVDGYSKITATTISQHDYLSSVFTTNEQGKTVFSSRDVGVYSFRIAVFPTYQAKLDYELALNGAQDNIYDRLNKMLVTNLTINVVNTDVTGVEMDAGNIVLTLYSETDLISLGSDSTVSGDHPIGLKMLPETAETQVRLDEVVFGSILSVLNNGRNSITPNFVSSTDETETISDVSNMDVQNYNFSNLWLSDDLVVVDYVSFNNLQYYANNGAAVARVSLDEEDNITSVEEIKVLPAGSYLDFYINSEHGNKLYSGNAFEIYSSVGEGLNKSWKVVSKEKIENLRLGILIVNSEGLFEIDDLFTSTSVEISVTDLRVEIPESEYALKINYVIDDGVYSAQGEYLPVVRQDIIAENGIVNIIAGSYDSVVFVVPKLESGNYGVKVCEDIIFTTDDNKEYVLVGLINNGKFENRVQVTDFTIASTDLLLLNLYNDYKQSVEDLIKELSENEEKVLRGQLKAEKVTITPKYILNPYGFEENTIYFDQSVENENDKYFVYAQTQDHSVTFSATIDGMLRNIYNQLNIGTNFADYISVNTNNIRINYVELIDDAYGGGIKVHFEALGETNNNIYFKLTIDDVSVQSPALFIKSNQPETIVLKYISDEDVNSIDLSKYSDNLEGLPYLKIDLDYDNTNNIITQKLLLVNDSVETELDEYIFNNEITSSDTIGFVDKKFKIQSDVYYTSMNANILSIERRQEYTALKALRSGEGVIQVAINGFSSYMKFVVSSNIEIATTDNKSSFESTYTEPIGLGEYITISNGIPLNAEIVSFENLVWISYGAGELTLNEIDEVYTFVDSSEDQKEVLNISVLDDEWKFIRENNINVTITISFDIHTVFGDLTNIHITFTSDTTAEINTKYNFTVYQGLEINDLYSIYNNETTPSQSALIWIYTNSTEAQIFINKATNPVSSWTPRILGTSRIDIHVDNIDIGPFYVNVLPNIIATAETDVEIVDKQSISEIFKLEKYTQADWFNQTILGEFTEVTNNNLTISSSLNGISLENGKINIDSVVLKELSLTQNVTVTLNYGTYKLANADVSLSSNNATINYSSDTYDENFGVFTFMSYIPFVSPITYNNKQPISITCSGANVEFSYDSESEIFTMSTLTDVNSDAVLTFNFEGGHTFTTSLHDLKFNLSPYIPGKIEINAYSGTEFDLVAGVFNSIDVLKTDTNIKSITIYNADTTLLNNGYVENGGYVKGTESLNSGVEFAEISGDKIDFSVTYAITYVDNSVYYYPLTFALKNRQSIEVAYPYQEKAETTETETIFTNSVGFTFANIKDAKNLGAEHVADTVYALSDKIYEPVLVRKNSSTTINFTNSEFINRVKVANRNGISNDTTAIISLAAYQNIGRFASYADSEDVTIKGSSVTFNWISAAPRGYIIFKAETESSNFAYYIVYVYCEGSGENVAEIDENIQPINYSAINFSDALYNFETLQALNKDYLHYFLQSAEVVNDGGNTSYNDYIYKEINNVIIPEISNYAKLTIMVVYKNVQRVYNVDLLNVVIIPTVFDVSNGLNGDYGQYSATIAADALEVINPFVVNGGDLTSVNIDENAIFAELGNDNSTIKLNKKVDHDTDFDVIYTYSTGLALKVTYTYSGTTIIKSSTITTGEFNNNSKTFVNSVNIAEIIGPSYVGEININGALTIDLSSTTTGESITISGVEVTHICKESGKHYLTFKQGKTNQTIELNIQIVGMNNVVSTSTVTVKKGFYIAPADTSKRGVTAGYRITSDLTRTYSDKYGSSLTIQEQLATSEIDYYTYTIGGYTIYSLQQMGNNNFDYNFFGTDFGDLTANDFASYTGRTMKFIHLPQTKNITATITFNDYNESINVYITMAQSYSKIVAKYVVDGADHENVVSGNTINLFETLFNSGRMALIAGGEEIFSGVNFAAMGFNESSNPNFLKFSQGSTTFPATFSYVFEGEPEVLTATNLKFNSVSINTKATVSISNILGADVNSYTFQIMADDKTDGLTLNENLPSGSNYISIMMTDTNNSNEIYDTGNVLIGTSLDTIINVVNATGGYELYTILNGSYYDENEEIVNSMPSVNFGRAVAFVKENIYLYFDFDGYCLYARYYATSNPTEDLYEATITLRGTTSDLLTNFNVCFFNLEIEETNANNIDNVYASYTINVRDKILFDNNNLSLELTNGDANYLLFDANTNTITTYHVADSYSTDLKFNVVYNNQYIATVATYRLKVNRNLQYVVNADNPNNYLGENVQLQSVLYLSFEEKINEFFPLTVQIEENATSTNMNKKLALDIYKMHSQYDSTRREKLQNSNMSIYIDEAKNSSNIAQYVEVSGFNLIFHQDFTGDIVLTLGYVTGSGEVYTQDWFIEVVGILQIKYTSSNPNLARIQNSGQPFNSGDIITVLGEGHEEGNNATKALGYKASNYPSAAPYKAEIGYVIVENNTENSAKTNQELFNSGTEISLTNVTSLSNIEQSLPYVPSTDVSNRTTYIVVYQITISYLKEQNYNGTGWDDYSNASTVDHVYYVAYIVVNYMSVTANIAVVNVDSGLSNNSYIDMFYFAEVYTKELNKITITYNNGEYYANGTLKTESEIESYIGGLVSDGYTKSVKTTYGLGGVNSVFNCGFDRIQDFVTFIKSTTSIAMDRTVDETTTEIHFALEHIENGRYGINLLRLKGSASDDFTSSNPLFNNELISDLKVYSGGTITNRISKWTSTNNNGFKLTTSNVITPAGSTVKMYNLFTPLESGIEYMNYDILGVFKEDEWDSDAAKTWINITDADVTKMDLNKTITSKGSFKLYKLTYSGAGDANFAAIYSVSKDFYVLGSDTGTIAVVNYALTGETNFLVLNSTLDLTHAFKIYSMQETYTGSGRYQLGYRDATNITITSSLPDGITLTGSALTKDVNYSGNSIITVTSIINGTYALTFNVKVN